MSTSAIEMEVPFAENVTILVDTLCVDLSDGRTISVPLRVVSTVIARNLGRTKALAFDWPRSGYPLGGSRRRYKRRRSIGRQAVGREPSILQ
jgi:hypothetical protein